MGFVSVVSFSLTQEKQSHLNKNHPKRSFSNTYLCLIPFMVSLSNHEWPYDKLRANGVRVCLAERTRRKKRIEI